MSRPERRPHHGGVDSLFSEDQSISLGCPFGIPTRLHYTFLILFFVEVLLSLLHWREPLYILFVFLLYGPILLLTIVVHEYGHALATRKLGGEVGGIILWPLGGIALCGPPEGGVREDLLVAAAGPLTHVPQALIWLGLFAIVTGGDFIFFVSQNFGLLTKGGAMGFFTVLFAKSFWLNMYLMCFNLFVPAYPLDGGRCMAASLIMCGVSRERAAYVTSVLAMIIGLLFVLFGAFGYLFYFSPNSVYILLIGVIVMSSGKRLYDLTKMGRLNDHPLFGRNCYTEQEGAGGGSSEEGGSGDVTLQERTEAEVI